LKTRISSNSLAVLLAVVLLLTLTGIAAAQPDPQQPPRWGREQVETVIIGKFASELNLTPEQAEKFFPRFHQFENQADGMMRQQMDRRRELDSLSEDANANQQEVDKLLTEQSQHEQQISGLKRQFLTDVTVFLTPQQVSRCSILMDELPRRIHKLIEEHRDDNPQDQGSKEGRHSGHRSRRGY
jgi:Spy/CpxP family protein refolding chaperone